jgi:redox-sensing transcriptional repressor
MRHALGLTEDRPVLVAGAGNLGRALANYAGFAERGFPVVGVVDDDPAKIGSRVGPCDVRPVSELASLARGHHGVIGVIAVPASAAQEVADQLVAAGVTAILNFSPSVVVVPDSVSVRRVDLALELQVLSFYRRLQEVTLQQVRAAGEPEDRGLSAG